MRQNLGYAFGPTEGRRGRRSPGLAVQALTELGVAVPEIARVHRRSGSTSGRVPPPEIAIAVFADRDNRPGGFAFAR
ncbi:hypothetical protein [Acrocarpospora sp. B8E8]|uniref:hypothetical protein n=1 Tax=Acrocarpospora sp. B8E8 TaxID=3153572 RepID=UPI00325FA522